MNLWAAALPDEVFGQVVATKVSYPDTKWWDTLGKAEVELIPRWKRNLRVTDESGKHLGSAYDDKTGKKSTPKFMYSQQTKNQTRPKQKTQTPITQPEMRKGEVQF